MPRRLSDLPSPANVDLDGLVPPPRFGEVGFGSFLPATPAGAAARYAVEEAASRATDDERPRRWMRWRARRAEPGRGLYLDGGFGVGKTHLLAAAYHAAPTGSKRYLSFGELVHLIGVLGMGAAKESLGDARLLCLDEFELDDPGNTLIVKTFLAHAMDGGALVITTSNTPPLAQGTGRFAAQDFRREIQSIAARFGVVRVEGPDARGDAARARLMESSELPPEGPAVVHASWDELVVHLGRHHPSRYRAQLEAAGALAVRGARRLADQNDALRFVHFVDRAYDLRVPIWLAGEGPGHGPVDALFDTAYATGAFAAKYARATSRIAQILAEARSAAPAFSSAAG